MLTTVVGNYPKIPSSRDGTNLRKAINEEERGGIDKEQLEDAYKKTIIRSLKDQENAGVDIITDGQIRWLDLTWPFSISIESVHPGGLRRFYDNNVYYRRPQITGLMARTRDLIVPEYCFAAEKSNRPVKAVLCGPITFCDLSDNYYYKSFSKVAEAISEIIAMEVSGLVAAGCEHIQLDEPSLPQLPERMGLASALYSRIFDNIDAEYGLAIYFNSIREIVPGLFDLPLKFIGLDLVSHPDDIKLLEAFDTEKKLVAGLFDGRNIMLENVKSVIMSLEKLTVHIPLEKIILSPSCGLEFLPQKYAVAKMKRMSDVAAKLQPAGTK